MPQTSLARQRLAAGVTVVELLVETGLAASKSAARRLIEQGGVSLNGARLSNSEALITGADVQDGAMILRAGKKRHHRVVVM
jgi:tyrosyl-tRNA synthetase